MVNTITINNLKKNNKMEHTTLRKAVDTRSGFMFNIVDAIQRKTDKTIIRRISRLNPSTQHNWVGQITTIVSHPDGVHSFEKSRTNFYTSVEAFNNAIKTIARKSDNIVSI